MWVGRNWVRVAEQKWDGLQMRLRGDIVDMQENDDLVLHVKC